MLYLFLLNKTDLFSSKTRRILHIAPEISLQKVLSDVPSAFYLSGDIREGAAMVKLNIMDLDCEDETFDLVICSHVLEHVNDDRKSMAEMRRVLKADGYAIIQVPFGSTDETREDASVQTPEERELAYGYHDHVRLYGRSDFVQRLQGVGFEVRHYDAMGLFDLNTLARCAIDQLEEIFICYRHSPKNPLSATMQST